VGRVRVAVTGSTGLIGTALVRSLRADGHDVQRVVRESSSEPGAVQWDIAAETIDAPALEGVDAVVHLAGAGIGERRWTPDRKREILESRRNGTDLLARTIARLQTKPAVMLSASGINVYGDRGDEVLVEHSHRGEGFLADVVEAWENAAAPAVTAGIRTAFLRSGMVLAHPGGALDRLVALFGRGLGGRLGSGRQWWSWITLDDEVRAIRWLLEHEVAGPVNLTAPNPVNNADFTRTLAHVLHRPALLPVPRFGPAVVVGRELADELLFASLRVVPAVLVEHGFRFAHPSLEEALRAVLERPAA
jgi:uncharacterized protein (TIGR01777 family)